MLSYIVAEGGTFSYLFSHPASPLLRIIWVEAYRLEIEAAQLEGQRLADMFTGGESRRIQFSPRIDRFNVDSFKKGELPSMISMTGPWVMAQELRHDAYIKWAQLLKQHGIDPAKEGFTALALE